MAERQAQGNDSFARPLRSLGIPATSRTLLVPLIGVMENKMETTILENQMEKKMENEMETDPKKPRYL